jgi:hypothetical protein
MADDKDIQRAAEGMIILHGLNAELQAEKRAEQCLNQGDSKRTHIWRKVVTAIRELRRYNAGKGEPTG